VLDASILYSAYGSSWLGQSLPAYTTPSFAILPFSPLNETRAPLPDETWTGSSTKLSTDLACWPAQLSQTYNLPDSYWFDNGQGCNTTVDFFDLTNLTYKYNVMYIGYWNDAHLDWHLAGDNCTREASHQFLAIFADMVPDTREPVSNVSAVFCEPSYWKQDVSVTVSADSRRPADTSITALGPPVRLGDDEFNITAYEYFIGTGFSPVDEPRDYVATIGLEQYPALVDKSVPFPTTNMVGFALALHNGSLDDLHDTVALQSVFTAAHRHLFSHTVPRMLTAAVDSSTARGVIQYTMYGVVVSRPLSLAVESLLVFVAALAVLVLLVCRKAKSNLPEDPSSLGSLLGLLDGSDKLLHEFSPMDSLSERRLLDRLVGRRYQLSRQWVSSERPGVKVQLRAEGTENDHPSVSLEPSESCYEPVRPGWLRPTTGLAVVLLLVAAVIVLVYLKKQEVELGGLPRPTADFELLQVLENYIPLAFATLLEPFFLLITRLLCLLQPFHELRRGHASAKTTIDTTYASLPPQLNIFRALKARHLLLALLCMISIMMNGLAVALGALFNEFPVSVDRPVTLQVLRTPSLSRANILPFSSSSPFYDHFYVATSNLSTGTNLPPWIDTRFAYFPVGFPNASNDSTTRFSFDTRGFGFDVNCSAVPNPSSSPPYANYTDFNDYGFIMPVLTVNSPNGRSINCDSGGTIPQLVPAGAAAFDLVSTMKPLGNLDENDRVFCSQMLFATWARAHHPAQGKIFSSELRKSPTITTLYCQPTLRTSIFRVSVDPKGYILQSERKGDFDDISSFLDPTQLINITNQANLLISASDSGAWHNTSVSGTWMSYLAQLKSNSSKMVDPGESVPDPSNVIPLLEDLYRRLSASIIGLNLDMFQSAAAGPPLSGTVTVPETRIFMNYPAFAVSVGILVLSIGAVITLYVRERAFYLPRLPSSIGSLIPYVAASRVVGEYRMGKGDGDRRHSRETTYSFGSYVGVDGRPHVGIERDPFVVPLGTSLLRRPGEKAA